jgi:hypothetical protein
LVLRSHDQIPASHWSTLLPYHLVVGVVVVVGGVRCGAGRCGAVRRGAARGGAVRRGAARCAAVQCGAVLRAAVQCGAVRC